MIVKITKSLTIYLVGFILPQVYSKSKTKFAFVTTNSICQGEQVALMWPIIFNKNQEISFARQSFNGLIMQK